MGSETSSGGKSQRRVPLLLAFSLLLIIVLALALVKLPVLWGSDASVGPDNGTVAQTSPPGTTSEPSSAAAEPEEDVSNNANGVSSTVDANGFNLQIGGVEIDGGAGIAEAGTEVRVEPKSEFSLGEFAEFVTPVGQGVDITLGDHEQPKGEVHLRFNIGAQDWPDSGKLMVLGQASDRRRDAEFVETHVDPSTRTVTAVAGHLSWFTTVSIDEKGLGEKFGEWINAAAGVRTNKPECVDSPTRYSESYVMAAPWPTAAWVCLEETDSQVRVILQSNSGLVFDIESESGGVVTPSYATSVSDAVTLQAYALMYDNSSRRPDGILLPGGRASITFEKPFEAADITITANPALSQMATLTWGASMLVPDEMLKKIEWTECAIGVLQTPGADSATQARAVLDCLATAMDDVVGGLAGLLLSGPANLTNQIEGLVRTISGMSAERFTVYAVSQDSVRVIPSTAVWLYELPVSGFQTSGDPDVAEVWSEGRRAYFPESTNQWVGCNGEIASATYQLDGEWSTLSFAFALQSHAPEGLRVPWDVSVDGAVVHSSVAESGDQMERLELQVRGAEALTFTAHTNSVCGTASEGYGSLVQAYVTK